MIGHPLSFERAKVANIAAAARIASEIMIAGKRLESVVRDSLRFALVESRLVYIEGEYVSIVCRCVEAALTAAQQTESESEIAVVIEENISAAIDARLRELAASSPTR